MNRRIRYSLFLILTPLLQIGPVSELAEAGSEILQRQNLVAWCIVPFDAAKRGPAERAVMLKELGITRCAYDWRAEHVPTLEQEIIEYKKHGIDFFAFWSVHDDAFKLFEKHDLHPQIWHVMSDPGEGDQAAKVEKAAQAMLPLANRTAKLGCKLGLYNHGGWSGEPTNLVAVCKRLRDLGQKHVGIVYNFHHGHGHISDWAESFAMMKPYLHCLNLNGMNDEAKPKILGIGKGAHELQMIRTVVESDYDGPIGILDHRNDLDARESLQENRDGLELVRKQLRKQSDTAAVGSPGHQISYDAGHVAKLVNDAAKHGDVKRGAAVFANAKLACLSCHQIGQHGGTVGPDLLKVLKERKPNHIIESVLWPKRDVKPEFTVWQVVTTSGRVISGYREKSKVEGSGLRANRNSGEVVVLRDPATGKRTSIAQDDVEEMIAGSTVMPSGLTAAMSWQQQLDLFRFLNELREVSDVSPAVEHVIAHSSMHGPATFPIVAAPMAPERWSNATHPVARDRLYDFYTRQAEYFRSQHHVPMLLAPFPGMDGGQQGHWGNQNEDTWRDGRWNETKLGSVQSGVLHANGKAIGRAVCVRLGDEGQMSACFNPDTLTYEAVWRDGFVKYDAVRHGFVGGLRMDGELVATEPQSLPDKPFRYHGFYRHVDRVVFAYRIGDVEYLDSPWVADGKFSRERAPLEQHSLRHVFNGGPPQSLVEIETKIVSGNGRPYAIDTIELPYDNPWNAQLFCGGHDFLPNGDALVCTMQGDVWRVSGLDSGPDVNGKVTWRRFASGLHHALGLVVADDGIYVQCRDQLTRLTDLNNDGEADFYECFSNAFKTSPAGHDFICGLQRDTAGNFYTASGNQGLLRISPDGQDVKVLATGFRNPDGLGILPDGTLTVPVSEGEWTPASAINAVRRNVAATSSLENSATAKSHRQGDQPPHFGYRGPRDGQPPELPLVYLPRALDNSSGGQAFVGSDKFGPLKDQLLHFSFGAGTWFVVLRDEVNGQLQGAVVPMTGDFLSGVHRGRFHPNDGQLYVTGMAGWGSYTPDDGCFQRVRFTGDKFQMPVGFHLHENGVKIDFDQPLDKSIAADIGRQFAQCWNYRYSGAYGSVEFSTTHPGVAGHDPLAITSAYVLNDGKSLFLEIPGLQPVSQLHLRLHTNKDEAVSYNPAGGGHDLFITVHQLDKPFTDFPGYVPQQKTIAAHPLLTDMAMNAERVPNPWAKPIKGARAINVATGKNLSYATKEFTVKAGETLAFTLENPDVVPHNWVLVQPGALQSVGELGNQLIADPKAYARQYVPESHDVIAHTDIVPPGKQQTIFFTVPETPGRYPFLCTFPGHWMVMNGVMVVE